MVPSPSSADANTRSVPDAITHAFAHIRAIAFGESEPTDCIPDAFGEPYAESVTYSDCVALACPDCEPVTYSD